ncbi:L-seryl-tRNA(Sec) selenium transferase [Aureimonas psammosilenae]|uniref:L-seryl-tRNA(Sec) selenium transferase n=1 Tax=Aureimonas psammosilenae TaxID=2495496 RepID=UPI00126055BB|nr:L-seryl-tRNA(Sec) selenium transferase [Aureimonas psammosilenae]
MDERSSLRALPSVDVVLNGARGAALVERHGRASVVDAVRTVLARHREGIREGQPAPSLEGVAIDAGNLLDARNRSNLRPLFNLTGTVLHTNLGRALLAEAAVEAATTAMREALALEFDLDTGRRGERDSHLRRLLCELTGAEDATIVNNNAAAVLLALNAVAAGREAVVSRGELIEIGGAFRMPDIMARAGVKLVEVGTTNRTHPKDYRSALSADTALLMKVHTSNYRIEGFTAEVDGRELSAIAHEAGLPMMNDLGSGTLVDLSRWGLKREPTVAEAVAEGADLVTFSGDKLLGGPQAGFIVGKRDLIARINANPMKRALRVDKIRIAAMQATLQLYRDPDRLATRLPTLRLLSRPQSEIRALAERLLPEVAAFLPEGFTPSAAECHSQIGSGALPTDTIPSFGLSIEASGSALERLASIFRALPRPVIGHLHAGALRLDLRCLEDESGFIENLRSIRQAELFSA